LCHLRRLEEHNYLVEKSNVGSDILAHLIASDPETGVVTSLARSGVMERTQEYFPPELPNRLVFNKLPKSSILKVVDLRLKHKTDRLQHQVQVLSEMILETSLLSWKFVGRGRIVLDIDRLACEWLASNGYSDLYGARAIARVVRTDVLFPFARKLLRGTVRDGDTVKIRVGDGDGDMLEIVENHPEHPTVGKPESEVNSDEELPLRKA